ncbi:Gfo/Idh/MocA family protein [Telmatospirillum siberiense]|uniref:Gfo/Idh/MocA family oxidoreductase n=1 Tax=Telmatospirillum siberiense TaxID=382514 RepID=A0A2N3PY30_9PROT|nr:Gfo/Idh/MocA family oxidoreductase [Telmatospirillum siberiense]PKU25271.1 gfo/Idh/MocA family oxidoreductase [Telmatospirillum siberiense]
MKNARLRLGIVGLGMASQPHALALAELTERIDVAGAFSPSPERRAAFAEKTGFPVVDTLEELLADATVQAILLLTPPTTHLDLVERCAAAGKHVLMEKPIEVSLARSVALVERMEKAGLRLGIVFQHRFRPVVRRLRAALAEGAIGETIAASAEIRWWRPPAYYAQPGRGMKARDGGGVLITQAIHSLDVFCTLTGIPVVVGCFARTSPMRHIDTEDTAAGMLRFANGAIGTIGATTAAYPGFPERIELSGTLGTATLEGNSLRLLYHDGRQDVMEGDGPTGGGADPMAFDHGPHKALIADFAAAIIEGRDPDASGRSALAVHRLIDALLRSSTEGRLVQVEGD